MYIYIYIYIHIYIYRERERERKREKERERKIEREKERERERERERVRVDEGVGCVRETCRQANRGGRTSCRRLRRKRIRRRGPEARRKPRTSDERVWMPRP